MAITRKNSPLMRQLFVMSSIMFQTLSVGIILGYPTILLPSLMQKDSEILLDVDSASTIVAIRGLGFLVFLVLVYIMMQKGGRKCSQIVCVLLGLFGWILGIFARNKYHLMLMQTLLGCSLAGASASLTMVVGEYSSPRYRGMFLIIKTGFAASGIAIVHILGAYLYWRTVALIALVPTVVSIALAPFWPESPYWLASIGRFDDCTKAFQWLRGKGEEDLAELEDLLRKHKERLASDRQEKGMIAALKTYARYFKNKDFWRPLFAAIMLNNLVELSGRFVLTTYSISILTAMIKDEAAAYQITIFTDILSLILSFLATIVVKLMKRRTLLFSTSYICIVSLFICSVLLYLKSHSLLPDYCMWIAVCFYVIFICACGIGVVPLVIGIFGEIIPVIYKPVAGIACGIYGVILNSALNKTAPYLMSAVGPEGSFMTFSICMVVCTFILYKYLPETKDKTLQEIERHWEDEMKPKEDINNVEMSILKE